MSFLDLVDVFIAGQLREHGVSLQAIRKTYNHLKNQLGVAHPFCREEILTDGKHIFLGGLTKRGQEQIRNAIDGQYVFPQIIRPFLKSLTYDSSSRIACKWQINKIVTIDPGHCFGQPIIDKAGIPTTILATAYAGNSQNAKLVARWYGVKQSHVMAAVEFESKNAA